MSTIKIGDFTSAESWAIFPTKMSEGLEFFCEIPSCGVMLGADVCLRSLIMEGSSNFCGRNMSSDSEMSTFSEPSSNPEEGDLLESEDEDIEVVYSQITPYQDEP